MQAKKRHNDSLVSRCQAQGEGLESMIDAHQRGTANFGLDSDFTFRLSSRPQIFQARARQDKPAYRTMMRSGLLERTTGKGEGQRWSLETVSICQSLHHGMYEDNYCKLVARDIFFVTSQAFFPLT